MRLRAAVCLALLLALLPIAAVAQRCMGTINFTIREGGRATELVTPIHFSFDLSHPYASHAVSDDSRFEIFTYRVKDGRRIEPQGTLIPTTTFPCSRMMYGCCGDYEMVVVQHAPKVKSPVDSMSILFLNACDETFGMDIPYRPGKYSVLVCDTTKIPIDPAKSVMGYAYRPLEEQYPWRIYGGYDISGGLISMDRGLDSGKEFYFFGLSSYSFSPFPDLLCAQLAGDDSTTRAAFDHLCTGLGLVEERSYDTISDRREQITSIRIDQAGKVIHPIGVPPVTKLGVVVLRRADGGAFRRDSSPEVRALRESPLVAFAGAIVSLNRSRIVAFDNRFTLFVEHGDTTRIAALARALGLEVKRPEAGSVAWIYGHRIVTAVDDPGALYTVAAKAESISFLNGVTSVEMNLKAFEDPALQHR